MADLELLKYLAIKTGLGLKYISKDEKISMLLENLREIFPEVVLKGGTALSRVYLAKLGVNRFSEDIDLDFISDITLNEKISSIKERATKIKGFSIEDPRLLHRTLRLDCHYINEFEEKDRIKLEFYLAKVNFLKIDEILVKSPFIEAYPVIFKVYSLEDLMAQKIITLYNRMEGKDIYDVFYCLDLDFDKDNLFKILQTKIKSYSLNQTDFMKELIFKLKEAKKNIQYIGNSANHFIPSNLRPAWKIFIDTLNLKIEMKLFEKS